MRTGRGRAAGVAGPSTHPAECDGILLDLTMGERMEKHLGHLGASPELRAPHWEVCPLFQDEIKFPWKGCGPSAGSWGLPSTI